MSFTIGREKTFLDSNILIYLLDRDELKKDKVTLLLDPNFIISTQVVAENINFCLKKLRFTKERAFDHANFLLSKFNVITIEKTFFPLAFQLASKYQFSFWDSLSFRLAVRVYSALIRRYAAWHGNRRQTQNYQSIQTLIIFYV